MYNLQASQTVSRRRPSFCMVRRPQCDTTSCANPMRQQMLPYSVSSPLTSSLWNVCDRRQWSCSRGSGGSSLFDVLASWFYSSVGFKRPTMSRNRHALSHLPRDLPDPGPDGPAWIRCNDVLDPCLSLRRVDGKPAGRAESPGAGDGETSNYVLR